VDVRLSHGRAVALDEERLLDLRAFKRTVAPHQREEIRDGAAHPCPQRLRVGLENYPLQALVYRRLDEYDQAPYTDVLPVRVAGDHPAAVDAYAAAVAAEVADDVDVDRIGIEDFLFALVEDALQPRDPGHDLVGGRLVHAALDVRAGIDAEHV